MKDKKIILGLSISMIGFLSRVLWIKEFDEFFYIFTFILYGFSLMIIWKYERGKPSGIIFFILLTTILCFSIYNENNKNTYVNIAKQREKVGKIYLYEIDFGIDNKFKYYSNCTINASYSIIIVPYKQNHIYQNDYTH